MTTGTRVVFYAALATAIAFTSGSSVATLRGGNIPVDWVAEIRGIRIRRSIP